MSAGKHNIVIEQGSTFKQRLQIKTSDGTPVNLVGYQVRGMVRLAYTDTVPTATFSCVVTDAANGVVEITLSAATTAALVFTKGVYDIELVTPTTSVIRLIQGNVILSKEVTK